MTDGLSAASGGADRGVEQQEPISCGESPFITNEVATMLVEGKGVKYRKVPATKIVIMPHPFSVGTPGGVVCGDAGDGLALDEMGMPYPITAAVIAASYRPTKRATQE